MNTSMLNKNIETKNSFSYSKYIFSKMNKFRTIQCNITVGTQLLFNN